VTVSVPVPVSVCMYVEIIRKDAELQIVNVQEGEEEEKAFCKRALQHDPLRLSSSTGKNGRSAEEEVGPLKRQVCCKAGVRYDSQRPS
jgi:hypothetical protein